ncbi:MAG TPA: class I SAM-dependent methyltransferase [Sphingorhabdus sp.]|nr:class I SAM-dependent methyltransferase [Sphingorhabdus sp.]
MHALAGDHAELMDNVYRGQRFIYDLTRKYYLLGRDRLIAEMDVPDGGTVLEVGCGTGRNLAKLGSVWPECRLYGLDISAEMLKSAAANVAQANLQQRTILARGDAANFDAEALFGRRKFDRIMFSYTLSMIPDWQGALRQALDLLSTQGSIHIVDFGQQERLPVWFRGALQNWLQQFHVEPRAALEPCLDALAKTHARKASKASLFRDYSRMIVVA